MRRFGWVRVALFCLALALSAAPAQAREAGGSVSRGGSISRGGVPGSPFGRPPGGPLRPAPSTGLRNQGARLEAQQRSREISRDAELRREAERIRRAGSADDVESLRRRGEAEERVAERRAQAELGALSGPAHRRGVSSADLERTRAVVEFQRTRQRGPLRDRLAELERFVEQRDATGGSPRPQP
jgi:hypothetical protein